MNAIFWSFFLAQISSTLYEFFNFLKSLFVTSVEITSAIDYYQYTSDFLMSCYLISANRIRLNKDATFDTGLIDFNNTKLCKEKMTLSEGPHLFLYKGKILWVTNDIRNAQMIINIPFGTRFFARQLLKDIKDGYNNLTDSIRVFAWKDKYPQGWNPCVYPKRKIETVIFPPRDEIVEDMTDFFKAREWYAEKGIPYHRGYLFNGLPGTGKTSMSLALASYFNCQVYLLPVTGLSDAQNIDIITRYISPNSIVLIEDIDRLRDVVELTPEKQVMAGMRYDPKECLRNLLQILDGIQTPEGVVFIITSNDPTHIDPALLRTGRVDRRYFFGPASKQQARALFLRFFPDEMTAAGEFASSISDDIVMAELQEFLIRNVNDVAKARKFVKAE
jgi:mitochondrial chaperone BCS1